MAKWKDIRSPASEERVERYKREQEVEEALYEMSLAELRRARQLTQVELATNCGVTQAQVSRIERQTDLYLSTLAGYVAAMGGELELVGVFPDKRVRLNIADLRDDDKVPA